MPDNTPANSSAPINVTVLGSPRCDNAAMTEALRAIGIGPDGRPLDGRSGHYEAVQAMLPQLRAAGLGSENGWTAAIDGNHDGMVSNLEVAAALIGAAQVAHRRGIELKDVSLQEISAAMCKPLDQLKGKTETTCSISR